MPVTYKKRLLMTEIEGCGRCSFANYLGHSGAYECQHIDAKKQVGVGFRGPRDGFPEHCPLPQIEPEEHNEQV